jgi:hypothetical protein
VSNQRLFILVVLVLVVIFAIIRALARGNTRRRDPLVYSTSGLVVAVDLRLSRLRRFEPSRSNLKSDDPLTARLIVERGPGPASTIRETTGSTDRDPTLTCDWRPASGLTSAVKAQVFSSSWLINETFPNLRISDRAQRAAAVEQMQVTDQYYRFTLPNPLPVTIRESKTGRFEIEF